ncbi:MAG TPA: bifunctional YncE family protein/alkaline phosphatase family protein [Vicinamibacteria bacterium]|nr:bifunctional YncE family protein/alkaline phosphatase family protein [Vicinamibacteria bacterium]
MSLIAFLALALTLPTGTRLDPAGTSFDVGNMPLSLAMAPEGDRAVLLMSGWREEGLEVVDWRAGRVVQHLPQAGAFLGLAFSKDGRTLFASGGGEDVVYRYGWAGGEARLEGKLVLGTRAAGEPSSRYPAGLAVSPGGRQLYVAENLADTLAVVDVGSGRVVQRLPTGHYPYAVAVSTGGRVFVSEWGGRHVSVFAARPDGRLIPRRKIEVGRHPSALALDRNGGRLYVACASVDTVAVVDTRAGRVLARLEDPPPAGPREGSTPNALAVSADGARLFVAEADNNAIAVFDLSRGRLVGRVPVGWYPAAVAATAGHLLVANAKGRGSRPNPGMVQADAPLPPALPDYALGQLSGTLTVIDAAVLAPLEPLSARVAAANGWDGSRAPARYPPFRHVVYVIKENRTYDQVLGDVAEGDGDRSLLFFPRHMTPNHHALAERFGLFDRFFTNAEVSSQGHIWSTAAYVTDYTEKLVPSMYASRRPEREEGDADEPASGFLWSAALAKGLGFRIYGELGTQAPGSPARYTSTKPALVPYTSPTYPAYDLSIPDQRRADAWIAELAEFTRAGSMPALQILHLPNDHTAGARPGRGTPRAMMADNDLALGRMVEALSKSPFWKDTAMFVLEDDAQAGPDHVDSHRSVLLVVSAYNRAGVRHRFVNTTDVVATVEEILGLPPLSQFDHYGRPLREVFAETPDLAPYGALTPAVRLDEINPAGTPAARESARLRLEHPDSGQDALFNRILWRTIKGEGVAFPTPQRPSTLELLRSRP